MATEVTRRVTSEIMRNIRDSIREQERRYLQHETNLPIRKISWKLERNPNSAYSWEYKVVTRGWRVSPAEKGKRVRLGRISCYARILEMLFKKKEFTKKKKDLKWTKEIENAIQGLIQLRMFERQSAEISERKRSEPTQIEISTNTRQANTEDNIRGNRRQELYGLWKEFVISTRIKEGQYERLPTLGEGRCECGRAKISYPHWPPTSTDEADAQFEYSIDEQNEHRRPLVMNWWRHFNELAELREWTASEPQQRYRDAEETIREASPVVQRELERTTKIQRRPRGWTCREYCERVLTENRCECLCFCAEHRDECPTHGRQ
jgi:hypothetical protein